MGQSETKNSRGGVTGKQVRGNYVESSKAIYWDGRSENGEYVSLVLLLSDSSRRLYRNQKDGNSEVIL